MEDFGKSKTAVIVANLLLAINALLHFISTDLSIQVPGRFSTGEHISTSRLRSNNKLPLAQTTTMKIEFQLQSIS